MNDPDARPVLLAVSGEDEVDAALRFAAEEARRAGGGLHLVHVVHEIPTGPELALISFAEARGVGSRALSTTAERAKDLMDGAGDVTTALLDGPVVPTLVEASARAHCVVLERRPLSRLRRLATWSVSSGVAGRAHVPVVSVPEGWVSETTGVVAVGLDDVEHGETVLRAGFAEARARGARLRVVHAWWTPARYDHFLDPEAREAYSASTHQRVEEALASLREEYAGVAVEPVVVHDRAADVLVAESASVDLLVVGRRDPFLPIGSHLGPVCRAVLRESACPVLVAEPAPPHHGQEIADNSRPVPLPMR